MGDALNNRVDVNTEAPASVSEPASCDSCRKSNLPRSTKQAEATGGWLWIEKAAVDRLFTQCVECDFPTAFSVYAALARLSSDRGNAVEVTTGMALVAKLSGCSKRSVLRAMAALERLRLIHVTRGRSGKENAENRYILLACRGSIIPPKAPSELKSLPPENEPFRVATLKEIREKGGVETPASFGAVAPSAVASPPSGNGIEPKPKKRKW